MTKQVTSNDRHLRVAYLWNHTIHQEEQLPHPVPVGLGEGELFPLPDGVTQAASIPVLRPVGNGYELVASAALGGSVWLGGRRRDLAELGQDGRGIPLGPEDYGVVTVGPVAVFFQHVKPAQAPPRQASKLDPSLIASVGLVTFLAFVAGLIVILYARQHPYDADPFALDVDRIAQYMVEPPTVTPDAPVSGGDENDDQGLRGREEVGGEAHEEAEGRVGREDARTEDTHIQGEVRDEVSTRVRNMGLLGALAGGESGNAIAAAINTPNVSDILAGMGSAPTVVGRGSGGTGLRGVGSGGGGTGPGNLFGAGGVGTGAGRGPGGGVGAGRGGAGAPGRARQEVQVNVRLGTARPSNGFLSPEQINRVVRRSASAIKYCYETQLQRQPNLRGQITISWTISLSGSVTGARLANSSMRNTSVEGCVVRVVGRMRFPEPDGGTVRVSYPFTFGS
jgi:hypothetical protein